ncbi:hypothetical protein EJ110_NYTH01487 [Nymphaea thermarum]|nr:hypothetical protein EJ110_NYTH01487 [Nymphaea thermarum]
MAPLSFEHATRGCCGSGKVEVIYMCNTLNPQTCPDSYKNMPSGTVSTRQRSLAACFSAAFLPSVSVRNIDHSYFSCI